MGLRFTAYRLESVRKVASTAYYTGRVLPDGICGMRLFGEAAYTQHRFHRVPASARGGDAGPRSAAGGLLRAAC
jgi:hypothetical protein